MLPTIFQSGCTNLHCHKVFATFYCKILNFCQSCRYVIIFLGHSSDYWWLWISFVFLLSKCPFSSFAHFLLGCISSFSLIYKSFNYIYFLFLSCLYGLQISFILFSLLKKSCLEVHHFNVVEFINNFLYCQCFLCLVLLSIAVYVVEVYFYFLPIQIASCSSSIYWKTCPFCTNLLCPYVCECVSWLSYSVLLIC